MGQLAGRGCTKNQVLSHTCGSGFDTMAVTGVTILVGNCGSTLVAVTVTDGEGEGVNVGVCVGVWVGVLLGGSVGVTRTKSAGIVMTSKGETCSEVETGMTTGDGVWLRMRVGAGVVGAKVTS